MKRLLEMVGGLIKDRRGDANTIGWIVLILFIILAVAPHIQDVGETMVTGTQELNSQLQDTIAN